MQDQPGPWRCAGQGDHQAQSTSTLQTSGQIHQCATPRCMVPPPQPGQIPCGTGLQAMRCGWAGNACTATRRLAACAYHTTCVCSETCGNCLRCTGGCLSIRTLGDGPGSQDIWIAKACGLHAIMAFSLAALEYILCKTEVRVSLGGAAR